MTSSHNTPPPEGPIAADQASGEQPLGRPLTDNNSQLPAYVREPILLSLVDITHLQLEAWVAAQQVHILRDLIRGELVELYHVGDALRQKFLTDQRVRAKWDDLDEIQHSNWCEHHRTVTNPDAPKVDGTTVSLEEIHAAMYRSSGDNHCKETAELINSYCGQVMGDRDLYHKALDLILDQVPEFVPVVEPEVDFPIAWALTSEDLRVLALAARVKAGVKRLNTIF